MNEKRNKLTSLILTIFWVLSLILVMISCVKENVPYVVYTVKAGDHYSNHRKLTFVEKDELTFSFWVNTTWWWEPGYSLSKVYGICWGSPEENSVRLAVRGTEKGPVLYMMCHVDGSDPITRKIDTVSNGLYNCKLGYKDNKYWLKFDTTTYYVDAPNDLGLGLLCHPYIGGEYVLDYDWTVKIINLWE